MSLIYRAQQHIVAACQQLDISCQQDQAERLLAYLDMVVLWNKAYNLTAITEPEQMLTKHIIDCLSVIPHLPEGRLLDVGTGAGFPGIIIGIMQPERVMVLLDASGKRVRFLRQVCADFKLTHIKPVQGRIEQLDMQQQLGSFAIVISRAFSSLPDFVAQGMPYVADDGALYAMKGHIPQDEIVQLSHYQLQTTTLVVPGLTDARHLIRIKN